VPVLGPQGYKAGLCGPTEGVVVIVVVVVVVEVVVIVAVIAVAVIK